VNARVFALFSRSGAGHGIKAQGNREEKRARDGFFLQGGVAGLYGTGVL
jgi:hypothetical protein